MAEQWYGRVHISCAALILRFCDIPQQFRLKGASGDLCANLFSQQCQRGCSGPCPVKLWISLTMEVSQTLCCSVWLPSWWFFTPLISTWTFPHCILSPLPFTLLLHASKKLVWIFSKWVVKDSDVIPPPPAFSLLGSEHSQLSHSLLVHPWNPSTCVMWCNSRVLSARLSVCRQGLLLLEQRGRPPCEGLWKITADTVISERN